MRRGAVALLEAGLRDTPPKCFARNAHYGYDGHMITESPESPVSSGNFKYQLRSVLDRVQHHGAHIPISRHREPAGIIVPMGWYERAAALMASHGGNGDSNG